MSKKTSSLFPDKKERTDFFIALTVVALFGVFIGYYILSDSSADEVTLEDMLAEADDVEGVAPITVQETETEELVTSIKKDKIVRITDGEDITPTTEYETTREASIVSTTSSQTDQMDATEESDRTSSSTASDDQEIKEDRDQATIEDNTAKAIEEKGAQIVDATSSTKTTESKAVDTPNASVNTEQNTTNETAVAPPTSTSIVKNIVNGKDCRIVVGAYSMKSSRDNMLKKLDPTDYQVVTYREKGLYIVAIHHTCEKNELRSAVKNIRENYAKGAFSLKK